MAPFGGQTLPTEVTSTQLRDLARRGAEERLRELREERRRIGAMLGTKYRPTTTSQARQPAGPKRRRKSMSAAQRKAVSVRMRKYWAVEFPGFSGDAVFEACGPLRIARDSDRRDDCGVGPDCKRCRCSQPRRPSLVLDFLDLLLDSLLFQTAEEGLGDGVVPAVGLAA